MTAGWPLSHHKAKRVAVAAAMLLGLAAQAAAEEEQRPAVRIGSSQLEPADWAKLEGWAEDDHLAAFTTFMASCKPILRAGPSAILPRTGRRCSIVWTENNREADRIVALPDAACHVELERRVGVRLGDIEVAGPRRAYPLGLSVARTFVADRLALVGDAAHVIHPIAGQGLNLGLRDVAALAEVIVDAARLGRDIAAPDVLDRYQRWRRFDTMTMGVATDGLNRLFSNRSDVLRLVRDVGLGLVDRMPLVKDFFIREAAGLTGQVPKLLRGEAL